MNVSETQCEYSRNPVGIDSSAPRLSWTTEAKCRGLAQTAYQIIISSSYELAKREIGDAWDSGKIESDECVNIAVPGSNLASSGKKYWWQVRVWDQSSAASEYSEISTLEFGLLDPWDWEGKWIGGANLLRGTFSLASNSIRSARAYVAGLGFYELSVNGAKVGDCVLSPAWTDYEKRILYDTFDVAQFLRTGKNAVGISLGTGRYKPAKESDLTKSGYGPVKAILQLNIEYDDGTKITFFTHPTTWRCADGPVISSDLFIGEKYDARLEKIGWDTPGYEEQGEGFRACELMEPPNGALVSSATLPPIRVVG